MTSTSCGEQDGPDCTQVLAEVYRLLDRECPQEKEAELRRHLEECPPCLEQYGIGEQLKKLLARKCGGEHAPDGLAERLRETIRATVAERTGDDVLAPGADTEAREA
ncbi:mycothiol system anti-sigma-R factor [Haloechinothrix sp. LS1_15]|uniref:mycothiol system anti-sigma-R factor n=1 Tax=Haloechinothrix sp. LS1_15 TaxID=2652248 RepID=UPI0029486729|nr:mycothiol system anti-sigma-R factor [Haloechinothrix sp. LS1_15]MDV6011586.1 mycothiol system anti-sigma-R factor [Haloechinothrix sp. LS1_15]